MRNPLVFTLLFLLAFPANAEVFKCVFHAKCLNIQPCENTSLDLSFETSFEGSGILADPLQTPKPIKPIKVWGLEEEFEAFPIGSASGDVVGFWGHMRISDKILAPGYFWGTESEQHVLTLRQGIARYSIHKPIKSEAIYLEGRCDINTS